jgi:hypothetical protein
MFKAPGACDGSAHAVAILYAERFYDGVIPMTKSLHVLSSGLSTLGIRIHDVEWEDIH